MCGRRGALQPRHLAGQDPEAAGALVLAAGVEQQLHPEADAEQRHAGFGALDQHLAEAGALEVAHRLREGADAGQDHGARGADGVRDRRVITDSAPTCSSAFSTLRRLPIP